MSDTLYERLSGRGPSQLTLRDSATVHAEPTEPTEQAEPRSFVTKRLRTPVIAAIAVSVVVLGAALFFTVTRMSSVSGNPAQTGVDDVGATSETSGEAEPSFTENTAMTLVHVVGAVKNSGVYELEAGARVIDALEAAGGASDDAALAAVNLARLVTDGEQLRVPTSAEAAAQAPLAGGTAAGPVAGGGSPASSAQLLNINTASASQLEELPRVGPALASRIIDYRTANGGFRTVDDLNAVSGIGDKLLDSIRNLVTV